jgi:hypothetical protein
MSFSLLPAGLTLPTDENNIATDAMRHDEALLFNGFEVSLFPSAFPSQRYKVICAELRGSVTHPVPMGQRVYTWHGGCPADVD